MRFLLLFLLLINPFFKDGDSNRLTMYLRHLKKIEFREAFNDLKKVKNESLRHDLLFLTTIISDNGQSLFKDLPNSLNNYKYHESNNDFQNVIKNLINGYTLLWYKNKRVDSFIFFQKAYNIAKKNESKELFKLVLNSILIFYNKGNLQNDNHFKKYLKEFYSLCEDKNDFLIYYSNNLNLMAQTELYDEKKSLHQDFSNKLLIKYDSVAKLINNKLLLFYYRDKANILIRESPKKASIFYLKQLSVSDTTIYYKPFKYYAYSNLSRVSYLTNNHRKGLKYLKKAEKYKNLNDTIKNNLVLSIYKAKHYASLKMNDSAYFLSEKIRKLGYLYNFQKHNTEISKIREELETKEKEKENLQLKQENLTSEAKRKQNQNLLYGALTILFLGGIIYYQNIKNSKRKRLLAEKQEELEKQKNISLIKEQEIISINAMVDGQEKERIRIAEDLHDNIGSVLATLKLHFENLKLNREKKHFNQDELYLKTEKLIDETYFKVRSLAHAKNSGVIANKGLLTAVKIMAEKISDANKIAIDVLDYGLEKPLENGLELTVFRIIQELTTNIIKHAEATNATINLALYDNNLNIIIEDNGKGFVLKAEELKNDGMGLGSIKTRIKHLKGTFDIDSTLRKGTSILMNIPV